MNRSPRKPAAKPQPSGTGRNELRIIAGEHRGRRLKFPDGEGLRPTPDRVRETVFNWLAPWLPDAQVLDLFAGSGALGFEALSRGVAHVTWVELNPRAAEQLQANLTLLRGGARGQIVRGNALTFLDNPPARPLDIVFLDPPFGHDWLAPICRKLEQGWLAPGAHIYVESEKDLALNWPETWELLKEKSAGNVCYRLLRAEY